MTNNEAKSIVKGQLESYLQQKGINTKRPFLCLNPDHADRSPSMSWDQKQNRVHCFGCGASYDTFDIVGIDYGLSNGKEIFDKAYEIFSLRPENAGTPSLSGQGYRHPKGETQQAAVPAAQSVNYTAYFQEVQSHISETDYPQLRGLSEATTKRFGLGFDSQFRTNSPAAWKALIIPTGKGSFMARNTDPNAAKQDRVRKRDGNPLYNTEALKQPEKPVFVVEGELDALSIIEAGGEAVALGGTANYRALLKLLEGQPPPQPLVLSLDTDAEGQKTEEILSAELQKRNIAFSRSNVSGQYKDANEALLADRDAFTARIRKAEVESPKAVDKGGRPKKIENSAPAGSPEPTYHKKDPSHWTDIFTAPASKMVVIAELKTRGLYREDCGNGKHAIICPWDHEHAEAATGKDTFFQEPSKLCRSGKFECQHKHRHAKGLHGLLEFLGLPQKPIVLIMPGKLDLILEATKVALTMTGDYYQWEENIVQIIVCGTTGKHEIKIIGLLEIPQVLSKVVQFQRYSGRAQKWVNVDAPLNVITGLASSLSFCPLPVLNGLSDKPFLREDGTLVNKSGYDVKSGLYCTFEAGDFLVPEVPTALEGRVALSEIEGLLAEFPFVSPEDKSMALAAILTAAIRPSLPAAPMFHIRSTESGTGKSYLCKLISVFATDMQREPLSIPKTDDETEKRLFTELLQVPAVLEFDDVSANIKPLSMLCTLISNSTARCRILGTMTSKGLKLKTLILSSGVNKGPTKDMLRRCFVISMDPKLQDPTDRIFKRPNLAGEVLAARKKYVSLALTVVRAWIAEGRPRTKTRRYIGFDAWAELCLQPLLWLGCLDPGCLIARAKEDDPNREELESLLVTWEEEFGKKLVSIRELIAYAGLAANNNGPLHASLLHVAGCKGIVDNRRLGHWLKAHEGQIVDNRSFKRSDKKLHGAVLWKIETHGPG